MSKIIETYYKQANVMPLLLKQKMLKLQRNTDILKEFEYWIEHNEYLQPGVSVEGYTAKSLSELSKYRQIIPAGRLADYKYYNMEAVILRAFEVSDKLVADAARTK